jgi:hypothetical protein
MNETIGNIEDRLFMLQDKIRMAEMFIAHAKADAHELQEYIFDMHDLEFEKRMSI